MSLSKEKARENLAKLVEKFEKELSFGRANEYNEEATKFPFIQPLFEDILGWDVFADPFLVRISIKYNKCCGR